MTTKLKSVKLIPEAVAGFETVVSAGKEQVEKVFAMGKERIEAAVKSYEDVAAFNKQSVEAVVAAGNVAAKGLEGLNAEVLAFSKAQIEDTVAAAKAMMGVKTLQELVDLHSGYAKTAFDAFVSETTKLGELSTKLAQETFEPINAQVKAAVEKFAKPLAA